MGHMLLTVEGEDVSTFQTFLSFLELGVFYKFIATDQEQGNKISMTSYSYNGPQCLIQNRFTYANDLLMTSNSRSLLLDLSSPIGLIKEVGRQCSISRKREPYLNDLHQPLF
jgi:hypothetical protein